MGSRRRNQPGCLGPKPPAPEPSGGPRGQPPDREPRKTTIARVSPTEPDPPADSDPSLSDRPKVTDALRASHLREVIQQYSEALRARRAGLDDLNVYPVPDGDTGTNMSLTMQSVVAELKDAAADDMQTVAQAISRGAVMGARGNSGAILAQVLRGVAESAKEKTSLSPTDVADALERARRSAYEAVVKPVEGTILTVVSAAAAAARKSAEAGHKLEEQMEHVRSASAEALARTPDLLPVLKAAGVVDAGGSGFLLFVDALRYVATGEPIPGLTDAETGAGGGPPRFAGHDTEGGHSGEIADLRYEVMFLFEADDSAIPAFKQAWSQVGESIVVVGGDGLWNCHIHADQIGPTIEVALDHGRPKAIRVTDLLEQSADHGGSWVADAVAEQEAIDAEPVETAVVVVASGTRLGRLFRSFGVQRIVAGGQSMNPSVADLLAAVEAVPSETVIVLPNNKNIHAAATQLDALTSKRVVVVPTTSVVQGLAAVVAYRPDVPADDQLAEIEAAAEIVTGEVTQAVRNALTPAGPVEKGDWLGIGPDGICVVEASLEACLVELVTTLTGDDHELLTILEGESATAEVTNALRAWAAEHRPALEVEVHRGDQPLYPYLLGVE